MSGILDFLTQPREQLQGAQSTLLSLPGASGAEEAMLPPTMAEKPQGGGGGLMGGIGGLLGKLTSTTPDGINFGDRLYAIGEALGGGDAAGYLHGRRQELTQAQLLKQKKDAIARKNEALKAAYVAGPDGKRKFDPGAYIAALGDDNEADLGELATLHNALAPKVGVSGDTPYSIDDEGQVEWGQPRGPSQAEQQAEARAAEIERHNREMERLMGGRAESYDYSVRHRAGRGGGGRGGGASVPALPPGFVVEK